MILKKDLSKDYTKYVFRLPIIGSDRMDIEIKILMEESFRFMIKNYEYDFMPTNEQIIDGSDERSKEIIRHNSDYEDEYMIYSYTFQSSSNAQYFGIHVIPYSDYDYSLLIFRIDLTRYKYSKI